jgi:putative ABC transport system permease protein
MLKNYLLASVRHFAKQRFFTLINVAGLAIGIASFILIGLYIRDELSYDTHYPSVDRLYRVGVDMHFGDMSGDLAVSPPIAAKVMTADFPEIEMAGRIRPDGPYMVRPKGSEKQNIQVKNVYFCDPEVITLLGISMQGPAGADYLSKPQTAIISRSVAKKVFGNEPAAGKELELDGRTVYQVTGVFEDFPKNSHVHPDMLLAMAGYEDAQSPIWLSHNYHTYLRLKQGASREGLEAKFPKMIDTYVMPQVQQFFNADREQMAQSGNSLRYYLQPVKDIHLGGTKMGDLEPLGDIRYVWVFGIVAIFILLIACINFVNLSTARSAGRAREVGVRKAIGSSRRDLVLQFMTESILVSIIALVAGVLLAWALLPVFGSLSNKELTIPFGDFRFWLWALAGGIATGAVAGAYPALFISSFAPIDALRGRVQTGKSAQYFRQALVVFQFSISIALIIGAVVVYQQMRYLQTRKMGFDREQLLIVEEVYLTRDNLQNFRNQVAEIPGVKRVSVCSFLPVVSEFTNNTIFWPTGQHQVDKEVLMYNWGVDFDFIQTLGIEMAEGRAFSRDFTTDSTAYILNETAVRAFGFKDPIGQKISKFWGAGNNDNPSERSGTVIGVMKDFAHGPVKEDVQPLCIEIGTWGRYLAVKVDRGNARRLIRKIEDRWNEAAPSQPFLFFFADEKFDRMVRNETRVGQIFLAFSTLAISIACLGLFALAAFMVERRSKEISIRRVLGASSGQIVGLFSREFMILVGIALAIATPVGLYFIEQWLQSFAFRVNFMQAALIALVVAGLSSAFIALSTVSSTAIRAALESPAANLRGE